MAQGKGQRVSSFYIMAKRNSHRLLKLWERLLVAKDAFQATALSLALSLAPIFAFMGLRVSGVLIKTTE